MNTHTQTCMHTDISHSSPQAQAHITVLILFSIPPHCQIVGKESHSAIKGENKEKDILI